MLRKKGMAMRYAPVAVLTALMLMLSSKAFAETAWDVLARFGWTGVWSVSCQEMASPQNYRMTYFKDDNGLARRKVDRGPNKPILMSVVENPQIVNTTTIAARIRNDDPNYGTDNGLFFDIVMILDNGRMRTLESKGSDGVTYIKDGLLSGKPSPWVEQCAN
jgi:hypothetical protein